MLSTGETLNTWVRTKLLTKAGKEVLARTAFNAILAAVALPMTVYRYVLLDSGQSKTSNFKGWDSTTGLALDNDWIRACDKARKAGDLLSEVLKEKVQGERPITIVSLSLFRLAVSVELTKYVGSFIARSTSIIQGIACVGGF